MKKIGLVPAVLATAIALLGPGCVQKEQEIDADSARDAIPSEIKINLPESGSSKLPAIGQLADYYVITRGVSLSLNTGAAFVLVTVRLITLFPPTSIENDTVTWGPWTDALNPSEYRLTVRMTADDDFDWRLEGRRKADGAGAEFRAVVAGLATPGRPGRGSGSFSIDFDVSEELDPAGNDGNGVLDVTYDLESAPATVEMDFQTQAPQPEGETALAILHYAYAENRDGSGDFQFGFFADLDENGSAWETAEIRSRWLATGAGRGDASVSGGDLTQTVTATECWDRNFLRVFYTDSVEWIPTEGDAGDCAFSSALLPE